MSKRTYIKIRVLQPCRIEGEHCEPNHVQEVEEKEAKVLIAMGRAKKDDGKEVKVPQRTSRVEKAVAPAGDNAEFLKRLEAAEKTAAEANKRAEKLEKDLAAAQKAEPKAAK